MSTIPVAGPSITQKEIDYVTDAVTNAWYSNHAKYHDLFEKRCREYLGVRYAISLPSCTSAIHLSLASLGVGPGDEVIVPDVTWIASAAPITYVGATTVFADIDPQRWCLSPEAFEACIGPRTKAVIAVDLYGCMPDMDAIRNIATRHGIAVIEDAAEAMGSEYRGKKAGSLGDTGVFSFHGSKIVTTGEGGLLVTNDEHIHRQSMFLRDHGRLPGDRFFFNEKVAFKYKMSSLQAALGLAQMERVEELVQKKREIFQWYVQALSSVEGITLNPEPPNTKNVYWMVTAIAEPSLNLTSATWMKRMDQAGIDTRPFFHPLSSLPAYRDTEQARAASKRNQNAYELSPRGLNLPSGFNMTPELVNRVCTVLKESLRR